MRLLIKYTILLLVLNTSLFSQTEKQVGDIEFKTKKKNTNTYQSRVKLTQEQIKQAEKILDTPSTTKIYFNDSSINHLSRSFNICNEKHGICQFILDAMLFIDINNSKIEKKVDCSNTLGYLKNWLKNGYSKEFESKIKPGQLNEYKEFKSKELRKYAGCSEAVDKILNKNGEIDSTIVDSIRKTRVLLNSYIGQGLDLES